MVASRYMGAGFVLFASPGARIAATLAVAVLGAAGAAAAIRYPDGAHQAAVASIGDMAALPAAGHLAAMAAYAGRFPDLVRGDVYGLGRARVAQILARDPQPGLREPTLDETLADAYDLADPAVAAYVDRLRADPAASTRLVASERAFQAKLLSERLDVPAGDLHPSIVHAAVRFGTKAGTTLYLISTGAGPDQLPSTISVDGGVLRAMGAGSGVEALMQFASESPQRPSGSGPGIVSR
ncbi:MAG: hypothetical protein K2Y56_20930 [Methylobacterium sp.]|uniref:hypothetical protein n=1 Tax=Methylobacterium sp. TaxID=409 RepID=UPI0025D0C384|nr:hypothetical protein [Methylobacterium sp.]MBX9933953.1 hypothetical protein [Methylobacterium sp.]